MGFWIMMLDLNLAENSDVRDFESSTNRKGLERIKERELIRSDDD